MYRNDMLLHVNMQNLLHGRKELLPVVTLPIFYIFFFIFDSLRGDEEHLQASTQTISKYSSVKDWGSNRLYFCWQCSNNDVFCEHGQILY
jgi:hypothetical protein